MRPPRGAGTGRGARAGGPVALGRVHRCRPVPGRDLRVRRTHRPGELSRQPSALRPAPPPGPPRGRLHQPGCSAPPGGGARGRLPMSPGPTCPGRVPRTSRGSVARAGPAHPGPRSSPGRGDADNNRCKAHNRRGARVPALPATPGDRLLSRPRSPGAPAAHAPFVRAQGARRATTGAGPLGLLPVGVPIARSAEALGVSPAGPASPTGCLSVQNGGGVRPRPAPAA